MNDLVAAQPPWETEGDSKIFEHEGFECLIIRHPQFKTLNGYVSIPPGHPLQDVEDMDSVFNVHGTWTFDDSSANAVLSSAEGIKFGATKGARLVGFDCLHSFDYCPGMAEHLAGLSDLLKVTTDNYRDMEYVTKELHNAVDAMVKWTEQQKG